MTFRAPLLAALAVFLIANLAVGPTPAKGQTFDADEKKAIGSIIREYLLANPEVLIESMQEYQRQKETSERSQVKEKLARYSDILKSTAGSPVTGNPDGDVTVIEFFDYRCTYCKKVFPTVQKLLKEDRNIRFVFKEYPILGPVSTSAARASLAMWIIDPAKYMTFHTSVMTVRGQLTDARIFKLAGKAGYDVDDVREKMKSDAVETEIGTNMRLAQELGISGTPAFIIGDHVVPGAVDMATLKRLVRAARN